MQVDIKIMKPWTVIADPNGISINGTAETGISWVFSIIQYQPVSGCIANFIRFISDSDEGILNFLKELKESIEKQIANLELGRNLYEGKK